MPNSHGVLITRLAESGNVLCRAVRPLRQEFVVRVPRWHRAWFETVVLGLRNAGLRVYVEPAVSRRWFGLVQTFPVVVRNYPPNTERRA